MKLHRLDKVVWSVAAFLILVIALLVWRGDHVGVGIVSATPANNLAAASAPVVIQFRERMNTSQVQDHFQILPAVEGVFYWRENTMYFLPNRPFERNVSYQAQLSAGAESQLGHKLLNDMVLNFKVREAGVAFLRESEHGYELWGMPDLKSNPVQLSKTDNGVFDYTVSIDGEQLVYSVVNKQSGIDLWEVSRDGGDGHMLLNCGMDRCFAPDASPDGQIAYSRAPGPMGPGDPYGPPRVWLLDTRTGETVRLHADTQKIGYGPSWAPDAQRLAYYDGVQARIVVLDIRNGNEIYLPSVAGVVGSWSPDGQQMIYYDTLIVGNTTTNLIYRADFETQDVLPFFDPQPTDGSYSDPVVSPDGDWIAIKVHPHEVGSGEQIWITPKDGHYAMVVVDDPGYLYIDYSWSPDSKALIFYRLQLGSANRQPEVWVWQQETGVPELLVEEASSPLWLP